MIERVFKALLWLFPAEFRRRFADELLVTARDVDRNRRKRTSLPRAIADVVATALQKSISFTNRNGGRASLPAHKAVLDAIVARDARKAEKKMNAIIASVRDQIAEADV